MKNEKLIEFHKNIFGPIVMYYLQKLDSSIRYLENNETKFLFTARAGFRIWKMYNLYLKVNNLSVPKNCELFLASRFLIAKSHLLSHNKDVINIFTKEYELKSVGDFLKGLIRFDNNHKIEDFKVNDLSDDALAFIENKDFSKNKKIKYYLENEHQKFHEYFHLTIRNCKKIVIIDSGWNGTIQSLIRKLYPQLEVYGLYFGKITNSKTDLYAHHNSLGLVFENTIGESYNNFDVNLTETVFTLYRHLIEFMFEPNAESVEFIFKNDNGIFQANDQKNLEHEELNWEYDSIYLSTLEFIRETGIQSLSSLHKNFRIAMNQLAKEITFPTSESIARYGRMSRSFDFGKEGHIGVILPSKDRFQGDSPTLRIKESLWPSGQIFQEYKNISMSKVKEEQLNLFHADKIEGYGSVAIITRTKDRPILLKRAALSVGEQTYKNYIWVVINDGGEPSFVNEIIEKSYVDPRKIIVVHNEYNIGMEAASNKAILQCDSDYIVIHDDDDSWEPNFLEKTVAFLESEKGKKYGAVISGTNYISETIHENFDSVEIHEKKPYMEWVKNIHITEMAAGNVFAPIAFLFKRSLYNKIGGFDESLPVLGDWDFNLRYLMEADIGVITDRLANYHHRDRNTVPDAYSNSVIGGISKHMEYTSIVRNKFVRSNNLILSNLINNGYNQYDMRIKMANLNKTTSNQKHDQEMSKLAHTINGSVFELTKIVLELKNEVQENEKKSLQQIQQLKEEANKQMLTILDNYKKENHFQLFESLKYMQKENEKRMLETILYNQELNWYLTRKNLPDFNPKDFPETFNNEFYENEYEDVRDAIKNGIFLTGFQHYIKFGFIEKRKRLPQ